MNISNSTLILYLFYVYRIFQINVCRVMEYVTRNDLVIHIHGSVFLESVFLPVKVTVLFI